MADRVAVINKGRLEQFDAPNTVYDLPASLFVNQFVGAANTLTARMGADGQSVELGGCTLPARAVSPGLKAGDAVKACIRPEHLCLSADGAGMAGQLALSLPQGAHIIQEVTLAAGGSVKVVQPRSEGAQVFAPGTALHAQLKPGFLVNAFAA